MCESAPFRQERRGDVFVKSDAIVSIEEEKSVWKFVELGVMGQWRRRLEDRRGACLSMRRLTWWRGVGGWIDQARGRVYDDSIPVRKDGR
jgi:hypothetical protein